MMSTLPADYAFEKSLLVLARHLIVEMRAINYPAEWSRPPLATLIPSFVKVLNYHPQKLGTVFQAAYDRTFPVMEPGNINQLRGGLFARTRQYFLDEYFVGEIPEDDDCATDEMPIPTEELAALAAQVVGVFAMLTPEQENEHRTLERICLALEPIFSCSREAKPLGRELAEYADQWRGLPAAERRDLAKRLTALLIQPA